MNNLRLIIYTVLISTFFTVAIIHDSYGQPITFVVPEPLANTAGNISAPVVFPCFPAPSLRAQGVYSASELPFGEIISIVNRIEPFGNGFGPVVVPNITLELSTTSAEPGALSETFADNTGPDAVVVFQGDVTLATPDCTTSPCPFNAGMVEFQQPFAYNPANGNLLVDLTIPTCVPGITNGDVTDQFPSIGSGIISVPYDSPTGIVGTGFLITQFTFDPSLPSFPRQVPTMNQWGLIVFIALLGIAGFVAIRRKRLST